MTTAASTHCHGAGSHSATTSACRAATTTSASSASDRAE